MSSLKVSSNYQVVIPKAVRQKLDIAKGQTVYIKKVGKKDVTLTTESPIDRYYGILKDVWDEDPVEYQRRVRQDRELP